MNISHPFQICRAVYMEKRSKGCPSVGITQLSSNMLIGETSDGKAMIAGVKGCCRWAMKCEVADAWFELNPTPQHGDEPSES